MANARTKPTLDQATDKLQKQVAALRRLGVTAKDSEMPSTITFKGCPFAQKLQEFKTSLEQQDPPLDETLKKVALEFCDQQLTELYKEMHEKALHGEPFDPSLEQWYDEKVTVIESELEGRIQEKFTGVVGGPLNNLAKSQESLYKLLAKTEPLLAENGLEEKLDSPDLAETELEEKLGPSDNLEEIRRDLERLSLANLDTQETYKDAQRMREERPTEKKNLQDALKVMKESAEQERMERKTPVDPDYPSEFQRQKKLEATQAEQEKLQKLIPNGHELQPAYNVVQEVGKVLAAVHAASEEKDPDQALITARVDFVKVSAKIFQQEFKQFPGLEKLDVNASLQDQIDQAKTALLNELNSHLNDKVDVEGIKNDPEAFKALMQSPEVGEIMEAKPELKLQRLRGNIESADEYREASAKGEAPQLIEMLDRLQDHSLEQFEKQSRGYLKNTDKEADQAFGKVKMEQDKQVEGQTEVQAKLKLQADERIQKLGTIVDGLEKNASRGTEDDKLLEECKKNIEEIRRSLDKTEEAKKTLSEADGAGKKVLDEVHKKTDVMLKETAAEHFDAMSNHLKKQEPHLKSYRRAQAWSWQTKGEDYVANDVFDNTREEDRKKRLGSGVSEVDLLGVTSEERKKGHQYEAGLIYTRRGSKLQIAYTYDEGQKKYYAQVLPPDSFEFKRPFKDLYKEKCRAEVDFLARSHAIVDVALPRDAMKKFGYDNSSKERLYGHLKTRLNVIAEKQVNVFRISKKGMPSDKELQQFKNSFVIVEEVVPGILKKNKLHAFYVDEDGKKHQVDDAAFQAHKSKLQSFGKASKMKDHPIEGAKVKRVRVTKTEELEMLRTLTVQGKDVAATMMANTGVGIDVAAERREITWAVQNGCISKKHAKRLNERLNAFDGVDYDPNKKLEAGETQDPRKAEAGQASLMSPVERQENELEDDNDNQPKIAGGPMIEEGKDEVASEIAGGPMIEEGEDEVAGQLISRKSLKKS